MLLARPRPDPRWILPWAEIGLLLTHLGRAQEAVAHLEGVAPECGPLDARYYAALGAARSLVGAHRPALEAFEASLELNPNDPSVAVAAAVAARLAGDRVRSNRHAKAARFLGAGTELTRSLWVTEAMTAVVQAEEPAGSAAGHVARARDHFLRGEGDRAVAQLDDALEVDSGNPGALVLRGLIHGYEGRHERAVADLTMAIRLRPGTALAHHYRGLSLGELDALEPAIADFDEALRLDPTLVPSLQARGECRLYRGECEAALDDFTAAIALDAEGARSYRGRGAAHRMRGELDWAIADLDTALRLDHEDAYAYRFRGDARLARGDTAGAIADFSGCLHRMPGDGPALRGRGSAHLLGGHLDLAVADFDAAIAGNPQGGLCLPRQGPCPRGPGGPGRCGRRLLPRQGAGICRALTSRARKPRSLRFTVHVLGHLPHVQRGVPWEHLRAVVRGRFRRLGDWTVSDRLRRTLTVGFSALIVVALVWACETAPPPVPNDPPRAPAVTPGSLPTEVPHREAPATEFLVQPQSADGVPVDEAVADPGTWRGLVVAPEYRCAPYDADDYPYSQSVEPRIVAGMGGIIYGPYTGTWFASTRETDIEHIVARSEAHDSGLCAVDAATKRQFSSDPLNLTLASPAVNRTQKSGKDAAEWIPALNQCWFAERVVQVRQRYGLTVDPRERDALDAVLQGCAATSMVVLDARPIQLIPTASAFTTGEGSGTLQLYDDNGNGRITCAEARRHGIAPVPADHPAYPYMDDRDGDGVVCE